MAENSFDWQQFLVYAQSVDLQSASEAALRTVVSRAYYAAYWKARRRVEKQHFTVPRQNAHQEVWDRYARVKNADGTPLKEFCEALKTKRANADYEARPPIKASDAELAIADAEDLIADIQALPS